LSLFIPLLPSLRQNCAPQKAAGFAK